MEKLNLRWKKITENDLEMIMNWRMEPEITKYMYTDPKLTIEEQKRWFEKISGKDDEFYWILEADETPCGFLNFTNWDKDADIIHTGSYIAVKEKRSMRLSADLQFGMYEFAFERLGVNKLCQEVLGNNISVVRLNERLGIKLEGVLRKAKKKNGEYFDIYVMGILREEWDELKKKVHYNKTEIEM